MRAFNELVRNAYGAVLLYAVKDEDEWDVQGANLFPEEVPDVPPSKAVVKGSVKIDGEWYDYLVAYRDLPDIMADEIADAYLDYHR